MGFNLYTNTTHQENLNHKFHAHLTGHLIENQKRTTKRSVHGVPRHSAPMLEIMTYPPKQGLCKGMFAHTWRQDWDCIGVLHKDVERTYLPPNSSTSLSRATAVSFKAGFFVENPKPLNPKPGVDTRSFDPRS